LKKKILLVEPEFPVPNKSKNHKDFLPVGLLKIGAMHKQKNNRVKLVRGNRNISEIQKSGESRWSVPHEIYITSLFTYWKPYVVDCVSHYKELYKDSYLDPVIKVGGIYASLMNEDCNKIDGVDYAHKGIVPEAEKFKPDYSLIEQNPEPLDYQVIHASRGCPRGCEFCGVTEIEPNFKSQKSIEGKMVKEKKKLVFYDNNLLMNENIDDLLDELIKLKKRGKIKWCESQSGFDGRELIKKPSLAKKIKKAGFRYPRIAWDWGYDEHEKIKKQIDLLIEAGYTNKQIFIFMIYNWDLTFNEMEKKRIKCFEWKVQIADCRYRPLNQTYDNYNSRKYKHGQSKDDYHIHTESGWTDKKVRQFRKNVRMQNICVRHGFNFYSKDLERMRYSKEKIKEIMKKTDKLPSREKMIEYLEKENVHYRFLDEIIPPKEEDKKIEDYY